MELLFHLLYGLVAFGFSCISYSLDLNRNLPRPWFKEAPVRRSTVELARFCQVGDGAGGGHLDSRKSNIPPVEEIMRRLARLVGSMNFPENRAGRGAAGR